MPPASTDPRLPAMADTVPQGLKSLLGTPEPPELGPRSRPGVLDTKALDARLEEALNHTRLADESRQLTRALVLLWHDHLDAAHTLAQEVEDADGSFVHAIMHRREPDFGNSKYWWHRVGRHACFPEIAKRVKASLDSKGGDKLSARLMPQGNWDPMAFVDACAKASPQDKLLREIQRIETEVLLEHLLQRKSH